jgi:hypothetical protein
MSTSPPKTIRSSSIGASTLTIPPTITALSTGELTFTEFPPANRSSSTGESMEIRSSATKCRASASGADATIDVRRRRFSHLIWTIIL